MTARAWPVEFLEEPVALLRWFLAGSSVLAVHAAAVGLYLTLHDADRPAAGAPVMLIELAALPSAPQEQSAQETPQQQEQAKLDPEPEETPVEPEPMKEEPQPQVQPPLPDKVEPPPPVAKATAVLPARKPPPPKKAVEKKKKPQQMASAPSAPTRSAAPAAPQMGVSSADAQAAVAQWRDLVVAHLQRNKRYPASAQARNEQGVVRLAFSVDRNGRVLSHRIAGSSGYPDLDGEVSAMIVRAQPLPAFPPEMRQARMDIVVPLRFTQR